MLRIELGHYRKYRNAREYRDIPSAYCEGLEVTGDGKVIITLAKKLIQVGEDPNREVQVFRGHMCVFGPQSLQDWADDKVNSGEQPQHLREAQHG